MSGIAQYQNVFRVAKRDGVSNGVRARTGKRNRHPVSCSACRARKMKCDRQLPCLSCEKRGAGASCNYDNDNDTEQDGSWTSEAQIRLQRLEAMVTSLMQQSRTISDSRKDNEVQSVSSPDQSTRESLKSSIISSTGRLDSVGSETTYVGSTNWDSILENIRDLQEYLAPEFENAEEDSGPALILDTNHPLSLEDACNALPSKNVTDQLMFIYFDARHLEPPFLHRRKFLREYEAFWTEPSSQSFLWISMLFSVLCVACRIANASGKEIFDFPNDIARRAFFVKAGQALVTGKYYRARQYSVESILLYTHCKYMQGDDVDADSWMLVGIGIRVAIRKGYHRDARNLVNISAFEGEMRRRIFSLLQMFDLLLSFRAGLPAIIHERDCDTEPPNNFYDEDFDEDTEVLPTPRPPTEATPMLFWRTKSYFAKMLRRIVMLPTFGQVTPYETVMRMDKELREVRARVPEPLRVQVNNFASTNDAETALLHKINIELAYLKCICTLHRVYMTHERCNPRYAYSRKACVEAALQILQCQRELRTASLPGGKISQNGSLGSSILLDDFLRAAMITCVDLYENHVGGNINTAEERNEQATKYDALQRSCEIWQASKQISRNALRASTVLEVMLSRIPRPEEAGLSQDAPPDVSALALSPSNVGVYLAGSWGSQPSQNTDANGEAGAQGQLQNLNHSGPLNEMLTDPHNLDWGFVDQYLFERSNVGDYTVDWQSWNFSGLSSEPRNDS